MSKSSDPTCIKSVPTNDPAFVTQCGKQRHKCTYAIPLCDQHYKEIWNEKK
jgi:hypothetical protein